MKTKQILYLIACTSVKAGFDDIDERLRKKTIG